MQRVINQSDLDSSCWPIQVWGKEYCKTCPCRGTEECGADFGNAKKIKEGKMELKSRGMYGLFCPQKKRNNKKRRK